MRSLTAFCFVFSLLISTSTLWAGSITVFAAASLQNALEEIAQDFPDEVSLSFAGSGTIARQIAAGAPADVVVLANRHWMEWLEQQSIQIMEKRASVTSNSLVLIGGQMTDPFDEISVLPDRLAGERLAMGHRDAVPAGIYAQQWLRKAGLWDKISAHLAETDSVRAALALVARGDAPFGVVYATDAFSEPSVRIIYTVSANDHERIVYPAFALTKNGVAFLNQLQAPSAQDIFAAHGFQAATP